MCSAWSNIEGNAKKESVCAGAWSDVHPSPHAKSVSIVRTLRKICERAVVAHFTVLNIVEFGKESRQRRVIKRVE